MTTVLGTGKELGRCFEFGLIIAFRFGVNMVPNETGALVTMGVLSEAEASARGLDKVDMLGRGGGIIGLLFVNSRRFGDVGPS